MSSERISRASSTRSALVTLLISLLAYALIIVGFSFSLYNRYHNPEMKETRRPLSPLTPKPWSQKQTLRVMTYNVHDLYVASGHRRERMRAIGQWISELNPDVVGLQEAFIATDRHALIRELAETRLKYTKYYASGLVGSGLLILSAYPIQEVDFHRFSKNGRPLKFWHGDWWAGKGIALARLKVREGEYLDLFNLHMHARYDFTRARDEYFDDRCHQVREVRAVIERLAVHEIPGLLLGDFNATLSSPEMEPLRNIVSLLSPTSEDEIDLILKRDLERDLESSAPHHQVRLLSAQALTRTLMFKGREVSLSDHPAILSTLVIEPRP